MLEVADSSLDRDRGIKLRSYARAGIVCYWIVNLIDRQIEVHTQPTSTADTPTYQSREVIPAEAKLDLVCEGKLLSTLTAAELLPAPSGR